MNPTDQHLFLVVGPSGVGKNTVISRLVDQRKDIEFVPSSTTRSMRSGESPGSPYFFHDEEEFKRQLDSGDVAEFQVVHNNYYWTSLSRFQKVWSRNKSVITDVDVIGALRLTGLLPLKISSVYLTAPTSVLRERIQARNPEMSDDELETRLTRMEFENSLKGGFSASIVNENIEVTLSELNDIVNHVGMATPRPHVLYRIREDDLSKAKLKCSGLCSFIIGRDESLLMAVNRQVRAISYVCGIPNVPRIIDCFPISDQIHFDHGDDSLKVQEVELVFG